MSDQVSPNRFKKQKPELICHLAAQMDVRRSVADPAFDAQTNIIGMLNRLENAVRCGTRKVIFASTGGAVYGEGGPYPTTEDHEARPVSPYGISKLTGEHYLYYYQVAHGLNYVALRFANVYGPRQDPFGEAGVVAIFTKKMLVNDQPLINGNGMQTRDYVYVEDVVNAVLSALDNSVNDTFNIGTSTETSVNDLFRLLVEVIGLGSLGTSEGGSGKYSSVLQGEAITGGAGNFLTRLLLACSATS